MRNPHLIPISFSILAITGVLSGCGGTVTMDSKTSPSGTGPVPTVAAVGEQVNGVAPNRKQEVQFSEAMDSTTVNAQSFQVADSSGKMVQGTVSYDSDFNTASFLPNPPLQTNASYTVTITTAVASTGGMHLASPYSYTFNTRSDSDTSPLMINSVVPAANATCVSATAPIIITFDEAPDASTVNSTNIVVTGPGGAVIPVTMGINVTTTQVVLTPKSPLPSGTITVTVQNVGDLADVMIAAPYTWSFSTACGGSATGNEYLYIGAGVAAGTPEFLAYAIDGTTGKLNPVPGMPFQANLVANPTPCGNGCFLAPLADPLGRFLFYNFSWPVTQRGVGSMKVNPSTGSLENAGTLIANDPIIDNISADPQGRFVYGTGSTSAPGPYGNNWIVSMVVGSNGQLSFAPDGPFAYPEGNSGGNIPAPAATDKFVFASDPILYFEGVEQPSRMFTFELNQKTGEMGAVNNIPDGIHTAQQVITRSGKFLYSERHSLLSSGFEGPQELAGFQVNTDGSLTPIAQAPTPTPQQSPIITMSPNGNFLYVAGEIYPSTLPGPITASIRAYAIDQNTGSLSLTAEYTNLGDVGLQLWLDPATKFAYVAGGGPSTYTMNVFSVNAVNGALTPLPGSQIVIPSPADSVAIVRPQ